MLKGIAPGVWTLSTSLERFSNWRKLLDLPFLFLLALSSFGCIAEMYSEQRPSGFDLESEILRSSKETEKFFYPLSEKKFVPCCNHSFIKTCQQVSSNASGERRMLRLRLLFPIKYLEKLNRLLSRISTRNVAIPFPFCFADWPRLAVKIGPLGRNLASQKERDRLMPTELALNAL
jgi:hypothetical protein